MKPSVALEQHRAEIRTIVSNHRASNPRVFGSVLHGSDTEESDLDILVDSAENTSLFDLARIQNELEDLLGVQVDVLTPAELPSKFRDLVISEAVAV